MTSYLIIVNLVCLLLLVFNLTWYVFGNKVFIIIMYMDWSSLYTKPTGNMLYLISHNWKGGNSQVRGHYGNPFHWLLQFLGCSSQSVNTSTLIVFLYSVLSLLTCAGWEGDGFLQNISLDILDALRC